MGYGIWDMHRSEGESGSDDGGSRHLIRGLGRDYGFQLSLGRLGSLGLVGIQSPTTEEIRLKSP